jgi:tripartite-type tricarboxylate transporter receptor subunit TctC
MRRLPAPTAAAWIGLRGDWGQRDEYPARQITTIVPFPAATDTLARSLGEQMRAFLGQPVIAENVGGEAQSAGAIQTACAGAFLDCIAEFIIGRRSCADPLARNDG